MKTEATESSNLRPNLPRSDRAEQLKAMSISDLPAYSLMGVYYIQNTESGKFYIGSSQDVFSRISSHFSMLMSNSHHNAHLQRAYNKSGADRFVWGICEEVFGEGGLLQIEQEWMDVMGDYNICREAGSTRGVKLSEETRQKMSISRSGENNPMYGKKRPDIAALMSELKSGITLSDDHKRKMSESLKGSKGVWASPERAALLKEKLKGVNLGRVHTKETRAKISASLKGREISTAARENLRIASTGRIHTEETKKKISAAHLGKKLNLSDVERQRRAAACKLVTDSLTREQRSHALERALDAKRGVPLTEEHKAKLSAATKGRQLSEAHLHSLRSAASRRMPLTEEQKKAKSDAMKKTKAARTPEQVKEWKAKISAARAGKPLSEEHKAAIKASQACKTPEEKAAKQSKRRATIAAKAK